MKTEDLTPIPQNLLPTPYSLILNPCSLRVKTHDLDAAIHDLQRSAPEDFKRHVKLCLQTAGPYLDASTNNNNSLSFASGVVMSRSAGVYYLEAPRTCPSKLRIFGVGIRLTRGPPYEVRGLSSCM